MTAGPGYFDQTGRHDVLSGGIRMLPITTSKGTFRVWTKRTGNNPRLKVLLVHGGPGATHEYLLGFDSWFPAAGVEYYYYDQLGSGWSDQPDEPELWDFGRMAEELEQVRLGLGLGPDNLVVYGQSAGGVVAIEHALRYPGAARALIISNMMASGPAYNAYAQTVLKSELSAQVRAEIEAIEAAEDFANPRYMELLMPHHYEKHVLRMPAGAWPEPVSRSFSRVNQSIYVPMQGPSELGASGKVLAWDRFNDLKSIAIPTLTIGATHDSMDPRHMEAMARELPHGHYLHCPNGSHLALYDDQEVYMKGILAFLEALDP